MQVLLWVGAAVSAYLGYKMRGWWVPVAVAGVVLAGQFGIFQGSGGGPSVQLVGLGLMDAVMFYATFGIGRSLGQRRLRRRKGVR